MQAPALHSWVRDDLAKLRQVGIIATLEESVWLETLARSAHTPPGRESYVDPASPVIFAGVKFWPLTMLAMKWFQVWYEAFSDQPEVQGQVYLYAHIHSKPGDVALRELCDMDAVASAVSEWSNALPIREDQLPALQSLLQSMRDDSDVPAPPDPKKRDEPIHEGATPEEQAAALCSMFQGTTPEYWLTGISEKQAQVLAAGMVAAQSGGGGCWANSPERTRRIASYMNAVKWIKLRATGALSARGD
jgi:hypothetical protein